MPVLTGDESRRVHVLQRPVLRGDIMMQGAQASRLAKYSISTHPHIPVTIVLYNWYNICTRTQIKRAGKNSYIVQKLVISVNTL